MVWPVVNPAVSSPGPKFTPQGYCLAGKVAFMKSFRMFGNAIRPPADTLIVRNNRTTRSIFMVKENDDNGVDDVEDLGKDNECVDSADIL